MKDVQSEKDLRNIPLKHVGIKGLRWPIELRDKARGTQHSVAEVTLAVDLPHDMRGTHMSRFVECLRTLGPVGLADVEAILDQLKQHLQAERAFIELKFPYFVTKKAPVSGMKAPMDIDCVYKAEKGEKLRWRITAVVPVQTLCPCSMAFKRSCPASVLFPLPGLPVNTVIAPSASPPITSSSAGIMVLMRGTAVGS